jgi:DNA (cytosine-5)-methyltransferase 1
MGTNKYKNMTAFLDLFSGIGGFALAAYWAGLRFDKHYFSEIEPYAVELYKKRFPEAVFLGDIKNVDYSKLPKGEWLVTSGFPCQPHSDAGKKQGAEDERDLWPECRRMLRDLRPRIALFENVRGLLTSPGRGREGEFFNGVLSDIHACGYDAEWQVISAADVGAPHLRKRVWVVAYPDYTRDRTYGNGTDGDGQEKDGGLRPDVSNAYRTRQLQPQRGKPNFGGRISDGGGKISDTKSVYAQGQHEGQRQGESGRSGWWAIEPDVGRVAHGIPSSLDRLKGIGNSIVPQCAEMIFNLPAFDQWRLAAWVTK